FLNLLVIISISHFKKLHTPTNLIILSLAVADMLVGFVMPIEATRLIEMCWHFGDTFCGVFLVITGLLISASLYNLTLIAVDRYVAVCHPLLYQQKITTTKTLIIICICWMWSSAYNISFATDPSSRTHGCYGECPFMANSAWNMTDLFLSFLFPCTVIIILYLKGGKCVNEGSMRRKSESKAALTLGIIVTVHLLCWIPFYIYSISAASSTITNVLLWVLYINSGLNPMVYALFYPWFKKTVKLILTLKIFQPASSLVNIFTEH
ncbi:trace amine-associated receptor 13c-like, partial [Carassius gibelio]|uniref:trace amine-associated receptor 13c-like n=1 Tax=Carassius gibelio TaxID=101364 RepID=UPI002278AB7D